jgi:hypothetical protein
MTKHLPNSLDDAQQSVHQQKLIDVFGLPDNARNVVLTNQVVHGEDGSCFEGRITWQQLEKVWKPIFVRGRHKLLEVEEWQNRSRDLGRSPSNWLSVIVG